MIVGVIITLLYVLIRIPAGPSFMPYITLDSDPSLQAGIIEDRFLNFDGYFDIFDVVIREDNSPCGLACSPLTYLVDLEVNKGVLRLDPSINP